MNFDRVASHYRWLETVAFGDALQRARIMWLPEIKTPARVLIPGEGNGRFLCELLRTYPESQVDCVDASERMLELARARMKRKRLDGDQRVRFLEENLMTWSPSPNSYDLVVTNFFLDCFTESEIKTIVLKLSRALKRGAVWLLADFSTPDDGLRRLHALAWFWAMHRFFRAVAGISARNLTDPSPILEAHGFRRAQRQESHFGMVKSELWYN